ncbi:MAG TPA: hypothetical protein DDW52_18180, partial [Planctomycetaceae bacterium]|nr:hypothetical protein [Planctomycetaceae bacterium]
VIEVSDGAGGASTQAFRVLVAGGVANLPPVIASGAPRFTAVGEAYHYMVEASDPEGQAITYSLATSPDGMTIDASSGEVAWTPTAEQAGQHVVTIIATDEGGATAVESYQLDVLAQNTLPAILGEPPETAVAGASFSYDLVASDADLDPLSFELTQAPAGATVDAFGRITWETTNDDIGSHDFEVIASDPRGGQAMQSFTLDLVADTEPPKLSLIETPNDASRNILPWQGPFTVFARAIDNVEVASLTLLANGQDIPLDAAGTATFEFEDWFFDTISATAVAIDVNGNRTEKTITFNYDVPEGWSTNPGPEVPTAIITSPADNGTAVGMVSITGTADHENFGAYTLSYRHVDETSFTEFHRSTTPVVEGELGVWDTSLLLNDEYVIRLQVATTEGTANVVEHSVGLAGELKLGNFQLSFTDMVIPVAGIPIEITRIYDTLQADRQGDFGYGWRLQYRNTDLRVGLPKSGLEDIGIYTPLRPGVKVFLNVPGEGRQGFTFNPDIRVLPGWGGNNLVLARPRFTPDPGVTSTLGTGTSSYLQVNDRGELYAPGGIPYNPASPDFGGAYVLTTRLGFTYRIDGATGQLLSLQDRSNNRITFRDDGIFGSADGVEITITRDREGRVSRITDPAGEHFSYEYDQSGNLSRSIDRNGAETTYSYTIERPNYLDQVVDPLGRNGVRTEYDDDGRVSAVINAQGNSVTSSFDPENSLVVRTDAMGNTIVTEFDAAGNVAAFTDALGRRSEFSYDRNGNVLSETNANGDTQVYEYDSRSNLTAITSPNGSKVKMISDRFGNTISTTDELGNIWTTERGETGLIETVIAQNRDQSQLAYNEQGLVTEIQRPNGSVTQFSDFKMGQATQITQPNGAVVVRQLDAIGNVVNETTRSSTDTMSSSFTYDAEGRILTMDYEGASGANTYDKLGQLVEQTDSLGRTTKFSYDELGRLIRIEHADGSETKRNFDVLGRLASEVDQSGRETHYRYNAVGEQIQVLLPDATPDLSDNPTYQFEYDALGRLKSETDPKGNETVYYYDSVGNLTQKTTPRGGVYEFEYDGVGQLTKQVDPEGRTRSFIYSPQGLVTQEFLEGQLVSAFEYGPNGQVSARTDADGNTTQYGYDIAGNLTEITEPGGGRTVYIFDELGNLIESVDPNNGSTTQLYDLLGRIVQTTTSEGRVTSYEYDDAGQLLSETDPTGKVTRYSYDSLGRVVTVESGGSTKSFSYLPSGEITTQSIDSISVNYSYNPRGLLESVTDSEGSIVEYEYDLNGNITLLRSPLGNRQFSYDSENKLLQITDLDGGVTNYTRDLTGLPIRVEYPNGVSQVSKYDSNGLLIERSVLENEATLFSLIIDRTSSGLPERVERSDGRISLYTYSANQWLASEHHVAPTSETSYQYIYDAAGNRIEKIDNEGRSEISVYDRDNKLVSTSGEASREFTYDAAGRLTSVIENGQLLRTYGWDDFGNLSLVSYEGTTQTFTYDAFDQAVSTDTNGVSQSFVIDRNLANPRILETHSNASEAATGYTYGDAILAVSRDGQAWYQHTDNIGSPVASTSASGDLVVETARLAFGGLVDASDRTGAELGYAGEFEFSDLDLVYLRDRFYDTEVGRFISPDRFSGLQTDPLSQHSYQYAHNAPTSYTDPSGFLSYKEAAFVSSFLVGLGTFLTSVAREESLGEAALSAVSNSVIAFGATMAAPVLVPYTLGKVVLGGAAAYGAYSMFNEANSAKENIELAIARYRTFDDYEWHQVLSVGFLEVFGVGLQLSSFLVGGVPTYKKYNFLRVEASQKANTLAAAQKALAGMKPKRTNPPMLQPDVPIGGASPSQVKALNNSVKNNPALKNKPFRSRDYDGLNVYDSVRPDGSPR